MEKMKEHLSLLGMNVKDKVSGFVGVVTSVSFDLYGCIQAIVLPTCNDKNEPQESRWFDVNRLEVTGGPVMERPKFDWSPQAVASGDKGPADRPRSMPR